MLDGRVVSSPCTRALRVRSQWLVAGLLAMFCASGVAGAEAKRETPAGAYIGLGAVYAFEDFAPSFDDSAGIDARVGYRWNRYVATELQYQWLEGFDSTGAVPRLTPPATGAPRGGVELDTHLALFAGKFFASDGRVQPYLVAGFGALVVDTEILAIPFKKRFRVDSGFATRLGAGLDIHVSDHWVLELESAYLLTTGDVRRERYGSVGLALQYRF